jgi:L-amino acid N-acyltransferase YncA
VKTVIRHADAARDAHACAAIYAPYVTATPTSFEEVAPSAEEMAARIRRIEATHPWLVAEDDGEIVGYAYASLHRERAAYRWAADVALYVDASHHRRGLGRQLYEPLLDLLRRQRFRIACAGVTLPNDASVGLHEALGFEAVGVFKHIGWKAGAWQDVGWWQLRLLPRDNAPPNPLPPQRLKRQAPSA